MKVIKASYEILSPDINDPEAVKDIYKKIERAGRTCYKSESSITDDSAEKFVYSIVNKGHEAMIEHASMTVRFIVDRGVSHELVRHRIASFAQESTRYCNYTKDKFGKEITVIEPCFLADISEADKAMIQRCINQNIYIGDWLDNHTDDKVHRYFNWYSGCAGAEAAYFQMLDFGATPEEARSVLPNSLKTEVVMTANMREWRHFFKLRGTTAFGKPHPQMLEVASKLYSEFRKKMPALFNQDDIATI